VAGVVVVQQLALEDPADDLEIAMEVRREAGARGQSFVVERDQRPERGVGGVVVLTEREAVAALNAR